MKSIKWIIACAVIGLGIGLATRKMMSTQSNSSPAGPAPAMTGQELSVRNAGNEEFREALDEIRDSYEAQYSSAGYLRAMQDIVTQWLKWDDLAAFEYVFQCEEMNFIVRDGISARNAQPKSLASQIIGPYLLHNPERAWDLCQKNSLGLYSGELLTTWITVSVANNDPFLRGKFDLLERKAAEIYHREYLTGPATSEEKQKWNENILRRPDTEANRILWITSAKTMPISSPEEVIAILKDDSTAAEKKSMARLQLITFLNSCKSRTEINDILHALPPELKLRTAEDMLEPGKKNSLLLTAALTIIIDTDTWKTREKSLCVAVHHAIPHCANPMEQWNWALTLPERTDTEDLFRTSIRAAVYRDAKAVEKMILDLPSGWKRDNGLVTLIQTYLNWRREEGEIRALYNLIESEHFRTSADEMYKNAKR